MAMHVLSSIIQHVPCYECLGEEQDKRDSLPSMESVIESFGNINQTKAN